MDVELGGFLSQNSTYDYDEDYEYKEESGADGSGAVLIPLLYSVVLIVGLLGNVLLLVILALKRQSWRTSDTFILHLGVADILLLVTLPFWAAQAAQPSGWCFGNAFCKISGAVFHINFYCGVFLLAGIIVDRCLSIIHSTQLHFLRKPLLVQISCACVWGISLLLTIPDWAFLTAESGTSQEKPLCDYNYVQSGTNWQLLSRACHLSLGFLLPVVILIVCCSHVMLRLQQRSESLQSVIRVILPLVAAFFLCWIPYNITLIIDTFSSGSLKRALMATSALGCVHACLRPLLYLCLCRHFRKQTLALLKCAPADFKGSLWELGVGEEALPEQSHEEEKLKQMTSVQHDDEQSRKSPAMIQTQVI